MFPGRFSPQPTGWLALAAVGVYLLVVAGATASLADAASACSTWPTCHGSLLDSTVLVAYGHRILAAVVGVIVIGAAVSVTRKETSRGVRLATYAATALFPAQIGIGAVLAVSGGSLPIPGLHLLIGVGIFGALVVALAWHLEAETGAVTATDGAIRAQATAEQPPIQTDGHGQFSAPIAGSLRLRDRAGMYLELTKPRLMWLLSLVAVAAMALAGGTSLTLETVGLTLVGGVLAIGASGTFNNVLERDRDRRMDRTSDRPVATARIPRRNAFVFGLALAVASLASFWLVNALAAALGLIAILFYSVVYTLVLKPNTVQNTVLGGAAGALPALIGWAAVTGEVGVPGVALAAVIFVWTPAHFYNLALAYQDDYERAGFPMMPVVRGETTTRKHILLWLGTTLVASSALIWITKLGWVSAVATTLLGALFLWAVVRLHREQTEQAAFRAFHASNAYLGVFLLAIVVDVLIV